MSGWVKTCIKCGVEQYLTDFRHRNKKRSSARENVCRACRNARSRELDNVRRGGTGTPAGMLFWPQERLDELSRALDLGLSYRETAQVLGITKCALIGKLWRLGLCGNVAGPNTTTMQRLDALNANMDAVLAECAKVTTHRPLVSRAEGASLVNSRQLGPRA